MFLIEYPEGTEAEHKIESKVAKGWKISGYSDVGEQCRSDF